MSEKEAPAKVEVKEWDFGSLTDRHGVFIWVEKPVWAQSVSKPVPSNKTYPYYSYRNTTNRPIMRVFLDQTVMGKQCRWETKAIMQDKRTNKSNDFDFGNRVKIDSEDGHGSGQSSVDCDKIKAMIKSDPRYSSAIGK